MNIIEPSVLSGFMELLPEDQVRFNQTKDRIEEVFRRFGFWPLDTPNIEKEEILTAKGGGETAKQIYRIDPAAHSTPQALRFDLTVPLARYVAEHNQDLAFPFRRYQISKVWRGERSQKGRYREFYQADIDIIGREKLSLLNDAEVPAVVDRVFQSICEAKAVFHINHRRLLNGFFSYLGIEDREETLRTIDKLDKIGEEEVRAILQDDLGLSDDQTDRLFDFLEIGGDNEEILAGLKEWADREDMPEEFKEGYHDLAYIYRKMLEFGIEPDRVVIDLHITRGLDYYTGIVYETFLEGYEEIGSVCSGGRYDNLAENFSKEHLPGVGISLGLTRLFYQLKQADLLKLGGGHYLQALVLSMGEDAIDPAIHTVQALREAGIVCQMYFESGKMRKKFSYADKSDVRYTVIIGDREIEEGVLSVKNMETGDQVTMSLEELIDQIKQ